MHQLRAAASGRAWGRRSSARGGCVRACCSLTSSPTRYMPRQLSIPVGSLAGPCQFAGCMQVEFSLLGVLPGHVGLRGRLQAVEGSRDTVEVRSLFTLH